MWGSVRMFVCIVFIRLVRLVMVFVLRCVVLCRLVVCNRGWVMVVFGLGWWLGL